MKTAPATFVSKARHVHLIRISNGPFTASVEQYLKSLGLTVHSLNVGASEDLSKLFATLSASDNPAATAVLPLEGCQPPVDGSTSPTRVAKLSSLAVAAVEICAAQLTPERCTVAAQTADPFEASDLSMDVIRLSNSVESRSAFKQRVAAAGCTIAGQLMEDDQPTHDFEHPRDWWTSSGDTQLVPPFTEFLVESAFNRELTQNKLKEEAMGRVKDGRELDLKYHYVGWKMAENWNALTDDATYAHAKHRSGMSAQISAMAAVLPDVSFRYISLGPGDGKTDVALLPKLTREREITACFFVDVSIELLQVATDRVITGLIETDVFTPRHLRAVLGDFEEGLSKLASVLTTGDGDRSFFSLSGFTVGNSKERELLKSLAEGMSPGDFLLMDARLHDLGQVTEITEPQRAELLAPYESDAMKKFAFGPVEDLCDYTVRLEDPAIEIRYEPCVGTTFTTDVSNAINVYIDAVGMYANKEFREKVGLPWRMVPGREKKRALRLVTLTFYDFDSLVRWIEGTRAFTVRWKRKLNGTGLVLLERVDVS